jgi:hypothetical protein
VHLPRFIKVSTGVQAVLAFCNRNIRSCIVGITNEWIYELAVKDGHRCIDIHFKFSSSKSRRAHKTQKHIK